ncbi:hydroxymethylglutaryl-CoA synthase family protein [Spirochaeta lutea]|uniref:hydroxymethylglutaryl-CoA synthase family protein n=1 Tax=Spirochaeta lutea TaxID=1480694 RepID=UPI0006909068|nr:hydroxymethylglutaryl-CoA synthase [Spirochaeta lutea]
MTERVGISDISLYLPKNRISLDRILEKRAADDPKFERRLSRAIQSTDQKAIRFPSPWEDASVLAGNALIRLLKQGVSIDKLRYLVVGTETSVDMSKSMSAYVQGMIDQTEFALPSTISSYQVQHACAGATLGMLSIAGMLQSSALPGENGIVIASDIARYDAPSTAEITQGAGAAAMLIEQNPRLLSLDLQTQGFSSKNVDDFFRPLGSTTAKVKGRYSVDCYNNALDEAFLDYCSRSNKSPQEALQATDYFVFHVPFAKMASTAVRRLLGTYMEMSQQSAEEFLTNRGFFEALEVTANVGNMYTGAIYLNLMATLYQDYQRVGKDIIGKKILFSSYGSGNTMLVFEGEVLPDAPAVIEAWNPDDFLNHYVESDFSSYQSWLDRNYEPQTYNEQASRDSYTETVEPGCFYLESIRSDDEYREYKYRETR